MADTTRASKLQFFFCSGSFFLTQVRQVKVVFLLTLRNAATRLSSGGPLVVSRVSVFAQIEHAVIDKKIYSGSAAVCSLQPFKEKATVACDPHGCYADRAAGH